MQSPTPRPTTAPTTQPPTLAPTTAAPTQLPTLAPTTAAPTQLPTLAPTPMPTAAPTMTCPSKDVVTTQDPVALGEWAGASPVCTQATSIRGAGPGVYEVCLGVTSGILCASTSTRGRLQGVFFESSPFLAGSPASLTISSDDFTIGTVCRGTASSPLTSCGGLTIGQLAPLPFTVGFTVSGPATNWTRATTKALGCFQVGGVAWQGFGPAGWALGAVYNETGDSGAGTTKMAGRICAGSASPSDPPVPNPENNVVYSRQRFDDSNSAPQVCTTWDVTAVDLETIRVTVGVTRTPAIPCAFSSAQGMVEALFLDTSVFGVPGPEYLTISDGRWAGQGHIGVDRISRWL
jgi:hypothetical protein